MGLRRYTSGFETISREVCCSRTVLIPGCGAGYGVQAFHTAGYHVTAIDFSPAAIDQAGKMLGPLADKVVLGDFFTYGLRTAPLRSHL